MTVTLEAAMTSEHTINDAIITPFTSALDHRMPKTQGQGQPLGTKTVYEGR